MHWIAPSEKDAATETLEKRLWSPADQLRANSGLQAQEYSGPSIGITIRRFAKVRSTAERAVRWRRPAAARPFAASTRPTPPPATPRTPFTMPKHPAGSLAQHSRPEEQY